MKKTLVTLLLAIAASASGARVTRVAAQTKPRTATPQRARTRNNGAQDVGVVVSLGDFGAVGDGTTDDSPALQAALDALAGAGGGTLLVPAGRFAIITPVARDFSGVALSITISGVGSSIAVDPKGDSRTLSRDLNLASEFDIRAGRDINALTLSGLDTLLISDVTFMGTPDAETDANVALGLYRIKDATIQHCEFYGLSSLWGGAVVHADGSRLTINQSAFLGCTGNSGLRVPVVLNTNWEGFSMSETVFVDFGQRDELYGKLGLAAPFSWVMLGNAAPTTNLSPRRDAVLRNVFFDEGGFFGLSSIPDYYNPASADADLIYVSDLRMNVSSLNASGLYLTDTRHVVVERAQFGLSRAADSAVNLINVGDAVLDALDCEAAATRIHADASTGKLTVVNSTYTTLDSQAATTNVVTTDTPDADLVQQVRQQFLAALGREPDAAAHYYWADQLLGCADDNCAATRRQELSDYLAASPKPSFAIMGQVLDETGAPLSGVKVALGGSLAITTTTDTGGNFTFANLPTSGDYTATPSLMHYTFDAPSQNFKTPREDQAMQLAATINRYRLGGRVLNASGQPLPGATVTLSGSQDDIATTDADGNYSFTVRALGDYTVSVARANYAFATADQSFNDLAGDRTANFTGTLLNYKIAGRVTDGSAALTGATISLGGAHPATATTDASGNYSFTVPAEGDYTVSVSKTHYTFATPQQTFASLGGNQTADFSGALNHHNISGRVTKTGGQALAGVTVALSGSRTASAITDATGAYSFADLPAGGNYTVTPSKTDYSFQSPALAYDDLGADHTANFNASLVSYTLNGRIAEGTSGLGGVTVSLTGSKSATTTTDASGNYSFNVEAEGDYTITPAKTHYTFSPQPAIFHVLGGNRAADFAATLNRHSITVRVTDANGASLAGATLTLTGAQTVTAATDASGGYTFSNLPAGVNYTLAVSKNHYTFTTPTLAFNDLGANQTASFGGKLNTHTLSGRVADVNNRPISGVAVALSGSQSANAQSDANGLFSFNALPAGGNYTITLTALGLTFNPAARAFTDLGGDQWSDFVGAQTFYTISGHVVAKGGGIANALVTLSGSTAGAVLTDAGGAFSFNVPASGSYTVAVAKKGYTFDHALVSFNNVSVNCVANFKATTGKTPPHK
jgi:protocatechuate 3,4-dioxygenase beta subunit